MDSSFDHRIRDFRNILEGERGFVIGGGPSLLNTDLSLIEEETTLTTGLSSFDFKSDYHFIGDEFILKQNLDEVSKLNTRNLFTSKGIYTKYGVGDYFFVGHGEKKFHTEMDRNIYGGWTNVFLALQFAYYLGLNPVYMLGIDHKWDYDNVVSLGEDSKGNEVLQTAGYDLNHHQKDYFGDGTKWHRPSVDKMEESYEMAEKAYILKGRRLYNASIRSELSESIIPRVDYYSLF